MTFDFVVARKGYLDDSWFDLVVSDQIYNAWWTGCEPEPNDETQDSRDG